MRIKIFTPNENGKIELTKEELENLLNESYRQGWNDKPYYRDYYYSTYPNITLTGNAAETAYACSINNSATLTATDNSVMNEKEIEEFKVRLENEGVAIL